MIKANIKALVGIALLLSSSSLAKESEAWSYVGRTGPDKWSELDKEFAICREGITQSPINLDTKNLADDKVAIIFHYEPFEITVKDYSLKINNEPSKRLQLQKKRKPQIKKGHNSCP